MATWILIISIFGMFISTATFVVEIFSEIRFQRWLKSRRNVNDNKENDK